GSTSSRPTARASIRQSRSPVSSSRTTSDVRSAPVHPPLVGGCTDRLTAGSYNRKRRPAHRRGRPCEAMPARSCPGGSGSNHTATRHVRHQGCSWVTNQTTFHLHHLETPRRSRSA